MSVIATMQAIIVLCVIMFWWEVDCPYHGPCHNHIILGDEPEISASPIFCVLFPIVIVIQ